MEIDVQRHIRDRHNPELPSEAMKEEFELWEKEYTVENLTDLTVPQIESRKALFENRVHQLVSEHNPGRLVAENPALAASFGKPPYNSKEWEQARKMIRRKKEEITLRFDRAKGIVEKEETDSKQKYWVRLVDALSFDSISLR